ncbi:MAG TPA: hypothetical protein VFC46_02115 [Humisphaera sp.]|nr:hypothetical protein [Humisphaera sp.]
MQFIDTCGSYVVSDYGLRGIIASWLITVGPATASVKSLIDHPDSIQEMHQNPRSDITSSQLHETEVQTFVREQNLGPYIEIACVLISEFFPNNTYLMMEKKEDPEFPDEWVTLNIKVIGDVTSAIKAYDAFTSRFVAKVPAEFSRKIRLSLGTA